MAAAKKKPVKVGERWKRKADKRQAYVAVIEGDRALMASPEGFTIESVKDFTKAFDPDPVEKPDGA